MTRNEFEYNTRRTTDHWEEMFEKEDNALQVCNENRHDIQGNVKTSLNKPEEEDSWCCRR